MIQIDMPRLKNPKPQQHSFTTPKNNDLVEEKEKRCATPLASAAAELGDEGEEKMEFERSLSASPVATVEEKEKKAISPDLIVSQDESDYETQKRNGENEKPEREGEKDVISDHLFDNVQKKNEPMSNFTSTAVVGYKKRRPATSNLNPHLLSWLNKRFMLRDNAKTSASQVIKQYEQEFKDSDLYVPLQSYQVGQLLRRLFPGLQRCKITVNGKRVWVYKHLCPRADDTFPSGEMAAENEFPSISAAIKKKDTSSVGLPLMNVDFRLMKDDLEPMSGETNLSNEAQKHVKNSAILYNLLYPRHNDSRPKPTTFRRLSSGSSSALKHRPALPKHKTNPSKNPRDEAIVKWLKDNYEYAEGYYVKSLNVLKKYNQGRQTEVRYLSQVGRIIKHVFPNARHLRRSLKGGKREWIYHNIRPKDHTEEDVWKGSKKNLSPPPSFIPSDSRPSLVPISSFQLVKKFHSIKPKPSGMANDYFDSHMANDGLSFLDRDNVPSRESAMTDSDFFRSEDGGVFHTGARSASATPSPASLQDLSGLLCKAENLEADLLENFAEENRTWSPFPGSENSKNPSPSDMSNNTGKKDNEKHKKSSLEAQISRLKCEKSDMGLFPPYLARSKAESSQENNDAEEQAEDLCTTDAGSTSSGKRKSPPCLSEEENQQKRKNGDTLSQEREQTRSKRAADHRFSFANIIDNDLRIKDFTRSNAHTPSMSALPSGLYDKGGLPSGRIPVPRNVQVNRPDDSIIRWEDLSMCDAHRFGWTLTPTLNNEIPPNFIEWVLFEGQWLREGQRVFRELKIYDDWSVSIHAMGKKVHPDELGGITDLSRTVKSVSKVFAILAAARSCRGLPALCLSDLCVHGVVVAKTEIWSSRESNCEELRHRAINCQVLYCGNEESCPKCYRVIRMHTQSNSNSLPAQNGYPSKDSNRFRTNTSL